ncbi:MAG: ATP-binding protein [archaeon]|nr:ATP-binding protein [archaeon]
MLEDEEIIEILNDWNFWSREQNTGIVRNEYLSCLRKLSGTKEIIDVTGVRRCGKSTILKQLIKDMISKGAKKEKMLYVNFEEVQFEPELSLQFLQRVYLAYQKYVNRAEESCIFLDEIQNIPKWEKWVRTIYDKHDGKIKVFVSGSSANLLRSELSSTLTGRHITLEIYPLSFKEFLSFKGMDITSKQGAILRSKQIRMLFVDYLEKGGFPEAVLRDDAATLLGQYFDDIVYRDVAERHKIREINIVRSIAIYLFTNTSKYFTYNKIKNSLPSKPSLETVIKYIDYLESAFLVFSVPIYSYKTMEQLRQPRKVYCIDTGMRNAICFRFRENLGQLAENCVYLELRRRKKEVYYWKDRYNEVDFVIKEGMKPSELIQVCWNLKDKSTRDREVKGLLKGMSEFGLDRGLIISEDYEGTETIGKKKIVYVALWKWMLGF